MLLTPLSKRCLLLGQCTAKSHTLPHILCTAAVRRPLCQFFHCGYSFTRLLKGGDIFIIANLIMSISNTLQSTSKTGIFCPN